MKNTSLKNLIKLSSKVTVYVPATSNVDQKIDNKAYVDECAALLSNLFGGATSSPALGYWLSGTAGLVKEHTTIVFAYCSDIDLQAHVDEVVDYCAKLKRELAQESVALEVNGEMYLI